MGTLIALFASTNNSISNKFLYSENIASSDTLPAVAPYDGTIKTVTYSGNSVSVTGTLEFRKNTTTGTPAFTVTLNTGPFVVTQVFSGLSVSIVSGDSINCKVASGASNVSKPLVKCYT